MSKSKIGTIEAIMVVLTVIVTHAILSLPRQLLVSTKSSTLINLLFVSFIAICISYWIYRMLKAFPGLDIIDISEFIGGKIFRNIIGIIFILYFSISSSIFLRSFCESLKIIYFPMTNTILVLFLFIIAVCLANKFDFSASLKTTLLILPLVIASVILLFFSNMKSFHVDSIFPILGDGILNTFVFGLTNLMSFGGIVYLYFLPPFLQEPEKFKKISLVSIGISAIYVIFCVATILFMFPFFLENDVLSPLYNATTYIDFGSFFQRMESLFLLIWILEFSCYISITTKFAMQIFKKITNIETKKPLIYVFGILILGISLIPKNSAMSQSFETNIYPYLVLGIVFAIGLIILITGNILKNKQKIERTS